MPRPSQREVLLDVAEQLMARDGIAALSVRAVNAAAGRSPASVHHYFGSREGLIEAVLRRRMEVLMARRAELLTPLWERHEAGDHPTTTEVLTAFTTPLVELVGTDGEHGLAYVRIVSRLFAERATLFFQVVLREFAVDLGRFDAMFASANPHLPIEMLWQRRLTAYQTIFAGLATLGLPDLLTGSDAVMPTPDQVAAVAADLIAFCAGGIAAPVQTAATADG